MTEEHLLLLAVRLRSRGTTEAVASCLADLGPLVGDVRPALESAEAAGQVKRRGDTDRWSLTGAGEAELAAWIAEDTKAIGRADVGTAYEAFLPLNRRLLAALSRTEAGQSADLETIRALVASLGPVLEALTSLSPRFAAYEPRFSAALLSARSDTSWIASPGRDSIHTIWFELHEHLLATLGRDRRSER